MKPIRITATEAIKRMAAWNKKMKKLLIKQDYLIDKEIKRFLKAASKKPLKNTRGI